MNYKKDKELLAHAMKIGCKTAGEFAGILRARKVMMCRKR